jgi:hypothetical protein
MFYRCPKCKQTGDGFGVQAQMALTAYIDSAGDQYDSFDGETEWTDKSMMTCQGCQHTAPSKDFWIENDEEVA